MALRSVKAAEAARRQQNPTSLAGQDRVKALSSVTEPAYPSRKRMSDAAEGSRPHAAGRRSTVFSEAGEGSREGTDLPPSNALAIEAAAAAAESAREQGYGRPPACRFRTHKVIAA